MSENRNIYPFIHCLTISTLKLINFEHNVSLHICEIWLTFGKIHQNRLPSYMVFFECHTLLQISPYIYNGNESASSASLPFLFCYLWPEALHCKIIPDNVFRLICIASRKSLCEQIIFKYLWVSEVSTVIQMLCNANFHSILPKCQLMLENNHGRAYIMSRTHV